MSKQHVEAIEQALPSDKHYLGPFGWTSTTARDTYFAAVPPDALRAILDRLAEAEKNEARYLWLRTRGDQGCTVRIAAGGGDELAKGDVLDGYVDRQIKHWGPI